MSLATSLAFRVAYQDCFGIGFNMALPFVVVSENVSKIFNNSDSNMENKASREELLAMAEISEDEGAIDEQEGDIIENLMKVIEN